MKQRTLMILFLAKLTSALDLEFDSIKCDNRLPAYIEENGVTMTCDGQTRCTLGGETAVISGELIYNGLQDYNVKNTTGYVSGNLQLMTLDYDLFQYLPFNFCGDWIMNAAYSYQECPSDGVYHFEVPYDLPESEGISTWFATGWEGVSYVKIYRGQSSQSALLAHCKIHFKTYVTDLGEDNWYTLPSAALTTIILFSVIGFLFVVVTCLACRDRRKHPTDDDYSTGFKAMVDDKDAVTAARDEEITVVEEPEFEEKVRMMSMKMNYKK